MTRSVQRSPMTSSARESRRRITFEQESGPRPVARPCLMSSLPARVVIVSDEQWARAGLRAELRERGVDAVGVRDIPEVLIHGHPQPGRGPVRLMVIEQDALSDEVRAGMLARVRARLGEPLVVLLAHATRETPPGDWDLVIRRPVTIGEVADAVQRFLPDAGSTGPIDC